jgi:hypothetical protein
MEETYSEKGSQEIARNLFINLHQKVRPEMVTASCNLNVVETIFLFVPF